MPATQLRSARLRIVVGIVTAGLGLLHASVADAIGQQVVATALPGESPGSLPCPMVVSANGSGTMSIYDCAVTVSTNAAPGPSVGGTTWSSGAVTATVTTPSTGFACGLTAGATGSLSFEYQDAYGSFAFNTTIQYYVQGSSCATNYAASFPTTPVKLSSATGIYSLMDELCAFSLTGATSAAVSLGLNGAIDFRVDNSAKGTCTPSNS